MERAKPVSRVVRYQALGLGVLVMGYWGVELPAWAGVILGIDTHTAWDRMESVLLTALSLVIALPIGVMTHRLVSRVGYLEGLLAAEARSGTRDRRGRNTLVTRLGDGNLTMAWRFARDTVVQSVRDPDRVGRVVSGRAYRSAAGRLLEEYEIELDDGVRFLAEGGDLRVLPHCDGRPMEFIGFREEARAGAESETLVYRCRECGASSELLL